MATGPIHFVVLPLRGVSECYPVRLLWRDGSTAAIIETQEDVQQVPCGITFVPTDECDEEGRLIFMEYVGTIH